MVEWIFDHVQDVELGAAQFGERARVAQRMGGIFGKVGRKQYVFELHHRRFSQLPKRDGAPARRESRAASYFVCRPTASRPKPTRTPRVARPCGARGAFPAQS